MSSRSAHRRKLAEMLIDELEKGKGLRCQARPPLPKLSPISQWKKGVTLASISRPQ
jgi:hypothetical protein